MRFGHSLLKKAGRAFRCIFYPAKKAVYKDAAAIPNAKYKTMKEITWSDFEKIEMRVGTIIEVKDFPEARKPAYQLQIDFGSEIGIKKTSAQITERYSREDLLGKQTIAVINFPKKQIANFMSECLIMGAVDGGEVTLIQPEAKVQNGLRIG